MGATNSTEADAVVAAKKLYDYTMTNLGKAVLDADHVRQNQCTDLLHALIRLWPGLDEYPAIKQRT